MRQDSAILTFATDGPGLVEITREIGHWLASTGIEQGLVTMLCRHTSASLLIQENAAFEVRGDLVDWLARAAPEGRHYAHDDEGPDDMPAHIKAMLTGVNLQIPVISGAMALGTWQGIYLAEHRSRAHRRQVAVHVLGE
ncbi:YjbQ family protein [Novosphingobium sp. YJ-S2-02]|uniref:YjbQ family protein n=1 Tax=Novosphingobium aureum TaxID=2792964 RepID=A0A931HFF4_9SPHN|nr:secondary thiamine-phosphate synthase enzyme YjbQ [Novosphingobium aureum]MBH0115130.1 YjbQ family protein [Novosphingobium aureum]